MEILDPPLAAALHELRMLDGRRRPAVAAEWVAQGMGGEVLAELAGLHGGEPEVGDLWPAALAEVGVPTPFGRARRQALPWLTSRVVSGEHDLPWLLQVLWPERCPETDEDPLLDGVVHSLDAILDHIGFLTERPSSARWLARRGSRRDAEVTRRVREQAREALAAMTRGDLVAAAALLGVPSADEE